MNKAIRMAIPIVWITWPAALADGPFGLRMGISRTEIESTTDRQLSETWEGRYVYRTDALPLGSKRFQEYRLLIAPGVGLCQVRALSHPIPTGSLGREMVEHFDELTAVLEHLYGPFQLHDELVADSRWSRPVDWMMGLATRERSLAAEWRREHGAGLPEETESILLQASARGLNEGHLVLEYTFQNLASCREVVLVAERDVF